MTTASIGIPFITNDCSGVPRLFVIRSTCFREKRSSKLEPVRDGSLASSDM